MVSDGTTCVDGVFDGCASQCNGGQAKRTAVKHDREASNRGKHLTARTARFSARLARFLAFLAWLERVLAATVVMVVSIVGSCAVKRVQLSAQLCHEE